MGEAAMLTLYGARGSGAAAVEAALRLVGAPYRFVEAATWLDVPAREELNRINPLGQIPALVLDDGSVLTESAAILIHLALAYPEAGLLPTSPAERAQMIRGLVYVAANCYAAIGVIDYPARWCADCDEATEKRIRAGTRARLHELWIRFADAFPVHPFLSGPAPGALDLLAAVVSRWSGARSHLAAHRPAFYQAMLAVDREPRLSELFERHWPPHGT
jgi:GST-like protein